MHGRWLPRLLVPILPAIVLVVSVAQSAEPARRGDLLSPEEWQRLDRSVDSGLRYLVTQQRPNGSFATLDIGQPAITSLCVMAFLSRGHVPQEGEYGQVLDRAIEFVLSTQQDDGLLFPLPIKKRTWGDNRHKIGAYNHAIAGVMLGEVYGMTPGTKSAALREAIRQAVEFTLAHQRMPKPNPEDQGGWRYLVPTSGFESDLSITAWEVMFLRSARNAEFDVPLECIQSAMAYVHRMYDPRTGTFGYGLKGSERTQQTRAMAGSGILLLSLGGEHNTDMARSAGRWLLDRPFDQYQRVIYGAERYHYGAYYCSQAMFQLGGEFWEQFFPPYMRVHLAEQNADGSWPREINRDGEYGSVYSTAMMILSLTPPYQLLPIYQR